MLVLQLYTYTEEAHTVAISNKQYASDIENCSSSISPSIRHLSKQN